MRIIMKKNFITTNIAWILHISLNLVSEIIIIIIMIIIIIIIIIIIVIIIIIIFIEEMNFTNK